MILQVLRQPSAPNAFYHAACYVPGQSEIVCGVLRLRDGQRCSACGSLILAGSHDEHEEREAEPVQLSLF